MPKSTIHFWTRSVINQAFGFAMDIACETVKIKAPRLGGHTHSLTLSALFLNGLPSPSLYSSGGWGMQEEN